VTTHRAPSFAETLRSIWRWWRPSRPSLQQQFAEAKLIERLAEELEAETSLTLLDETRQDAGQVPRDKFPALGTLDSSQAIGDHRGMPPLKPQRDRRVR
jgi:hypothetical protein